jgi:hypothetical protein
MLIAFTLTMPGRNTWNGRWSGDEKLYCVVRRFDGQKNAKRAAEILAKRSFRYSWGDGWCARIEASQVDSREAADLRRKSAGFYSYEWMIDRIVKYGDLLTDEQIAEQTAAQGT